MKTAGMFLTAESRLVHSSVNKKKYILYDNLVYWDNDGTLYLVPRNYVSDGYTIPNWIAWLGGGKMEYDLRPAHVHDFICQYHAAIKIKVGIATLRHNNILRQHYDKREGRWLAICDDVPVEWLEYVPFTKWECDCLFKRLMKATGNLSAYRVNLMRIGVFFNIGWLRSGKKKYDLARCYEKQGVYEENTKGSK